MPATQQASITVTDQLVYGWRRGRGAGVCLRCRHASSHPITQKFRRVLLGAKSLRQAWPQLLFLLMHRRVWSEQSLGVPAHRKWN